MESIVQLLKPHVSAFSAAIPLQHKHGDEVIVGGKIVGILNLHELLQNAENPDFHEEGVYVTLDDGIGLAQVVIPAIAYEAYVEKFNLGLGKIVLAKGKVSELDTSNTYKNKRGKTVTVDKHKTQTIRVLSWFMEELKPQLDKVKESEVN